MGYYIETETNKGKLEILVARYGAIRLTGKPTEVNPEFVPVCVIDNGPFEAAAICYNKQEAEQFNQKHDPRKREWCLLSRLNAETLCPRVKGKINWET